MNFNSWQCTWKLSQGDPGLKLIPPGGKLTAAANSLVDRQVCESVPFIQANSQSLRLSMLGIIWDVKKHSFNPHSKQIDPVQSPLIQS